MIRLAQVNEQGSIIRCFYGEFSDLSNNVLDAPEPWAVEGVNYDAAKLAHEQAQAMEAARKQALRNDQRVADMRARLDDATPGEIDAFVESEVTTLAGTRAMFKRILLLLAKQ